MKIYHWNVKDKNRTALTRRTFHTQLSALLTGARTRDDHGTVVFLTELMDTVRPADFAEFTTALNRKSSAGPGWTGRVFYAGRSQGGSRREKIGILTYNVEVEHYWQLVQPSVSSTRYAMERQEPGNAFTQTHQYNSRFPVGVRVRTRLGGSRTSLDIGGYHNQGPGHGADTRAGAVEAAAVTNRVHVLIGDFNTEPPPKRQATDENRGPATRSRSRTSALTESTMGSSRGGSLYDRAKITNDEVGGRQLTARNDTGFSASTSDHRWNSTVLTTRKRRRE